MVDNGAIQEAAYFAVFFFLRLYCKTKPDLYLQNILIATGRNYPLTKLLEKWTARTAAGLSSCLQKIFVIQKVFKQQQKSPEVMPYLKIRQFAMW